MEQVGAGEVDLSDRPRSSPSGRRARQIDEVIARFTDIIEFSRREHRRLGYFAALYRKVTVSVKHGILNGRFEDGASI